VRERLLLRRGRPRVRRLDQLLRDRHLDPVKRVLATVLVLVAGCARSDTPQDQGLVGLGLGAVQPGIAVPGTTIAITGDSFVDATWGTSQLRLTGDAAGQRVDVTVPAVFVDYTHMTATVTGALIEELGGDVDFAGDAVMEVVSAEDGQLYTSAPLPI